MNLGIENNEITQNYYNLTIAEKRREFYSEFYELIMVMNTLIKNKYPDAQLPSVENYDNIKNDEIDEDLYMTGLYEDLLVFKELFAYLLDDNQENPE